MDGRLSESNVVEGVSVWFLIIVNIYWNLETCWRGVPDDKCLAGFMVPETRVVEPFIESRPSFGEKVHEYDNNNKLILCSCV